MNLYLQFGWGMMDHCRELVPEMPQTTVILSPRDLSENQIVKLAGDIHALGGTTVLDPQLFDPRSDRLKLTSHAYWPQQYSTADAKLHDVLQDLWELNQKAMAKQFILPGLYCDRINNLYLNWQEDIMDMAQSQTHNAPRLGTLCLSAETIHFREQLELLLSRTDTWPVDGYYVIAEPPNGDYLVDNPSWLSNLLMFCVGLKLQNKKVILGYSNHQMLCMACAGIDAIASGTYMNVRSFTLDKFFEPDPDDRKRKKTWYYCPQALTEVTPEFLDVAFQRGVLKSLAPLPEYHSDYADFLFSGAIPTTTAYDEPLSFRHYLTCLYHQCQHVSLPSFKDRINYQRKMLSEARKMIGFMHKYGIRGQKRDFEDCIDVNLSALDTFEAERGFLLNRTPALFC